MVSNGLVALSSALLAQYQGFADVNMGRGAIVIGLAAVIIGEADFRHIFSKILLCAFSAVALGSILYYLVSADRHLARHRYRSAEAALRTCGGCIPRHPILEGTLFFKACKTGREFRHA